MKWRRMFEEGSDITEGWGSEKGGGKEVLRRVNRGESSRSETR